MTVTPVEMAGKKLLITGPTGQVAEPIVAHYANQAEVWTLARFSKDEDRNRIEALGIGSTAELLDSSDASIIRSLEAWFGEWLHTADRGSNEFLDGLRILGELLHPDDVFPDFARILFDSEAGFSEAADRFLADGSHRATVASTMRDAVIEHFSYSPAMARFLETMAGYLREAAL